MSEQQSRVAIVTGAAGGIGQEIAVDLVRAGHRVAVADLRPADETVALCEKEGGTCIAVECDITDADSVRDASREVRESIGPCEILVANAGVYPVAPFLETSWETWRHIMDVNVDSLFHLLGEFLPGMQERGWGRIVAAASGGFHTGIPGLAPYTASKGAVIGLIRSLAMEIGDSGVTINAYAPSLTRTPGTSTGVHDDFDMFALVAAQQSIHRTSQPRDVAPVVTFLASEGARFITGQTILVHGGLAKV